MCKTILKVNRKTFYQYLSQLIINIIISNHEQKKSQDKHCLKICIVHISVLLQRGKFLDENYKYI